MLLAFAFTFAVCNCDEKFVARFKQIKTKRKHIGITIYFRASAIDTIFVVAMRLIVIVIVSLSVYLSPPAPHRIGFHTF